MRRVMSGMNRVGVEDEFVTENVKHNWKDEGRRSGGVMEVVGAVLTVLSVVLILLTFPLTAWMCAKVLTADGLPLKVDAVLFYRVVDPSLWVTRVKNGYQATHTLAQTTLRATLGAHTLTDILTQRMSITKRMEEVLYTASRLWGVKVERVELKDLTLPFSLQRCMASEAETARNARAKMIVAEGEVKASRALKEAASGLSPVALQLRYLQSLSSIQSSASIVVFSLPIELLNMYFSHHP